MINIKSLEFLGPYIRILILAISALFISYNIGIEIYQMIPKDLNVMTDIVGYPIHHRFNIDLYFYQYYLAVIYLPIAIVFFYWVLGKVFDSICPLFEKLVLWQFKWFIYILQYLIVKVPQRIGFLLGGSIIRLADGYRKLNGQGLLRAFFSASLIGLEFCIVIGVKNRLFTHGLVAVLVLTGFLVLVSFQLKKHIFNLKPFSEVLSFVNILFIPFAIIGLFWVSSTTHVIDKSTGITHFFPWFPWWLAFPVFFGLMINTFYLFGYLKVVRDYRRIEVNYLIFITGGIFVFLLKGYLTGGGGISADFFHSGENLVATKLFMDGWFPWRDFIFIHGFFEDILRVWVGIELFEMSPWGKAVGLTLLVIPLYWTFFYFFCAWFFRKNWVFVLGSVFLIGILGYVHYRFSLQPLVYIAFCALLVKFSIWRSFWFIGLLFVQAIITPESGYTVIVFSTLLPLYEYSRFDLKLDLVRNFSRTIWAGLFGFLLLLFWAGFLGYHHALDDFIFYYQSFLPGHRYTGGIEASESIIYDWLWVPLLPLGITFFYIVIKKSRNFCLTPFDWTLIGNALFILFYYQKFMSRADGHIFHVVAVAIPLYFMLAYLLVGWLEVGTHLIWAKVFTSGLVPKFLMSTLILVFIHFYFPKSNWWLQNLQNKPSHFSLSVKAMGTQKPSKLAKKVKPELKKFLERYLTPDDTLFDFTNQPELFHYLYDFKPSTRYFHVSMAIRRVNQLDLIEHLEIKKPKLVIYYGGSGLNSWDGIPNMVRHYDVSHYILNHYRLAADVDGHLIMARRDWNIEFNTQGSTDAPSNSIREIKENKNINDGRGRPIPGYVSSCDWQYAPNFFDYPAPDRSSENVLQIFQAPAQNFMLGGWAVDLKSNRPAKKIVAMIDNRLISSATPNVNRSDVAAFLGSGGFTTSGYRLNVKNLSFEQLEHLRLYAITWDNSVSELDYLAKLFINKQKQSKAEMPQQLSGTEVLTRDPGAAKGFVDLLVTVPEQKQEKYLIIPITKGVSLTDYKWFEIETVVPFERERFILSDDPTFPSNRTISFNSLPTVPETNRYKVMTGSCYQWYQFGHKNLFLASDGNRQIQKIRLIK